MNTQEEKQDIFHQLGINEDLDDSDRNRSRHR